MTGLRRWLERRPGGERVIHADDAAGIDSTLCGYALEGVCMANDDPECEETYRGKINCERCIEIIRYAKTIPARLLGGRPK